MKYTDFEKMIHSVVQLEKLDSNQNVIGLGTGFVFGFCMQPNGASIKTIVTNRHVLENCSYIAATFTLQNSDGTPNFGHTHKVTIPTKCRLLHPDPNIDLGLLPLDLSNYNGDPLLFAYLQTNLIPSKQDWANFDAVEEVYTAGYPYGLRDIKNNLPIVRKGITATPLYTDFNGLPQFLVDMPCFNGCSGSPVFIVNSSGYTDNRTGEILLGTSRVFFLGIQFAIQIHKQRSTIEIANVQSIELQTTTDMPFNLGHIIKSSELLAFEEILAKLNS